MRPTKAILSHFLLGFTVLRRRKESKEEQEEKEEGGGEEEDKVWNPLFWVFGMNSHGELMLIGLGFWKRSPKP